MPKSRIVSSINGLVNAGINLFRTVTAGGEVEAAEAGDLSFYSGGGVDSDDWKYRQLNASPRDMSAHRFERAQRLSYWLWDTNPLAKRILELEKDIIVGDGFKVTTPDEDLQRVIDDHWNDPQNDWDTFLPKYYLDLKIFGEAIWPVTVNPINGVVQVGYIDPGRVKVVKKHPDNQKFEGEVWLKVPVGAPEKMLTVILTDTDPMSESFGRLSGECFFFALNKTMGATRGRPDLMPLIDWCDGLDKQLFDHMERTGLLNAFIWDVTIDGADDEFIKKWVKKRKTPKPGSMRVHNEKVTWEAKSPQNRARETSDSTQMIKNYVTGSRTLPEHWFGSGGDVNRATAQEMEFPTVKTLSAQQTYLKYMVRQIVRFVRDRAIIGKEIAETEEGKEIQVDAPEISSRDMVRIGSTMQTVVSALALARTNGWTGDEQAIKIIAQLSKQLGVEYSPEEVLELLNDVPAEEQKMFGKAAEEMRNKAGGKWRPRISSTN